jgi:hypothetical protein
MQKEIIQNSRILIADDQAANIRLLECILNGPATNTGPVLRTPARS